MIIDLVVGGLAYDATGSKEPRRDGATDATGRHKRDRRSREGGDQGLSEIKDGQEKRG